MTRLLESKGFSFVNIVIIIGVLAVLTAIAIPSFMRFHCGCEPSEAHANLAAIQAAQESYYAENGVYFECKPSPPDGDADGALARWMDAGGFTTIDFGPDGDVRYQYEVTVSSDGQSFTATATGDLDGDGEQAIYTVSTESESYPKPIRSGGDY